MGGESAARLADCLGEGGQLVIYGCMTGKAPAWPWQAWVFRDLKVGGWGWVGGGGGWGVGWGGVCGQA